MADNSFKVQKSINLNPQVAAPTNPVAGDMYFDNVLGSLTYYNSGSWACLDSIGGVTGAASMTSSLFTPAIVKNSLVRITSFGGALHGMSASFAGKRITLYNATAVSIVVHNESATETTANNRIKTPISGDMNLIAGEIAQFMYDSRQSRWLLVSVGSGAGAYLPATISRIGTVQLASAPVDDAAPVIPVVDASTNVVANGMTRSTAGIIDIGPGANDTSVRVKTLFAVGDIRPIYPVLSHGGPFPVIGLPNINIGGPTSYDSNFISLVNLQGSQNTLARGIAFSSPVRFTNTGNRDTLGVGLITEWCSQSTSGLLSVASINSTGWLTTTGVQSTTTLAIEAPTVNIGQSGASIAITGAVTATSDITATGNVQGALVKATSKFQYSTAVSKTVFCSASSMLGTGANFIGTGARPYWSDGGTSGSMHVHLSPHLPPGASITGLRIWGDVGSTTRTLSVSIVRQNGSISSSIYSNAGVSLVGGSVICSGTFTTYTIGSTGDYFEVLVSWTGPGGGDYTFIYGMEVTYSMQDVGPVV